MKNYYRIMLGYKSSFAEEAYKGGFIGVGWFENIDLTTRLADNWKDFNKEFIPLFLAENPEKTKISAGLACGKTWTIAKGIKIGDIILSPNGKGGYYVGEIISDYIYQQGNILPHRRVIHWFPQVINRDDMSTSLRNSVGSIGTVSNISRYGSEIDSLILGNTLQEEVGNIIEDQSVFALEKHLEDFLVQNWKSTELGKNYDIYEEEGEIVGQQYPSDTGPIDILAISKDKKELLVVELKRGRVSDAVVGQIQRYMGFVKDELAEEGQIVRGVIIGFEDDVRVRRALSVTQNIEFFTYKIQFTLEKK